MELLRSCAAIGSYRPASQELIGCAIIVGHTQIPLCVDNGLRCRTLTGIETVGPLFHLRNISAEPLLPGAVPLNGVPEGLFNKSLVCAIRTLEAEPPPPDQVAERIRRYAMFQGGTFMVSGFAEFPKAASPQQWPMSIKTIIGKRISKTRCSAESI